MALYLNNLDLNGNQLIKATVHPLGTAPATAQEGQIYYDTGDNVVYVNTSTTPSSPSWKSMGGDITGVSFTTDDSTTISDTSGDAAFTITGGAGITTSSTGSTITIVTSNDQDTTGNAATATKLASAVNIGGVSFDGSASITLVSGSIPNNAADTSGNAATVTTNANLTGHVTSVGNTASLGSFTVAQLSTALSDANISGNNTGDQTDITGNAATVTTNANLTGHVTSVGNTASLGSFTTAQLNAAISDGTINSQTLPTDFVSAANGGTFASAVTFSGNITANGNINGDNATDITAIDKITVKEIGMNTHGSNTSLKIGDQQSATITLGKVNSTGNTDATDVGVANNLTVGGSLTVNGGVTLKGDVILETTTNTALKDKILLLNQGQIGPPANTDDFGILFSRGHGTTDANSQAGKANMMIKWDESELEWQFIATDAVGTESGAVDDISGSGGEGEDVLGDSGFQHLRVGKMSSVTFHGNGAALTNLSGSAITSGTVAAARVATLNQDTTGEAGSVEFSLTVDNTTVGLSAGTNYNGSTAKTISAKTASIADGGTALATADQIHTFVTGFGYTTNTGTTTAGNTQTFTSKSIDADNNTLSNIEVDNFKASAIVTESEAIGSNDNDTTIPTSAAVKDYVDNATSSTGNTGGRQAFVLADATTGVAATSTTVFTITHGMGASRNYGVEIIRNSNNSGGGETVIVDVARPTDLTITVTFAVAPTAGDYTALVCKY